jgi:hypothetical protein
VDELTAPDLVVPDPAPPGDHGPVPAPGTEPAVMTDELVPGAPVLGVPTVDSDADGTPDTAVAQVDDELVLASDLDHDGHADAVTRIGPDAVVTAHHGEPAPPPDHPWDAPPLPPPSVDPHTGEWIRG